MKDRTVILVGLLGAGMAGHTRFADGMPRGPSWLDVVFLLAIAALLVGFWRSFGRAVSDMMHRHMDATHGEGSGGEDPPV